MYDLLYAYVLIGVSLDESFKIFNTCPGLTVTEEELYDMAGMLDDDTGDSREERVFRMWINSLGIEDLYINNLFEDLKDGVALLKVMDRVEPGIVSWRQVNRGQNLNKYKRVENCNYAVVLGKQMHFSLVGIGGVDIVDGNRKLVLALVWQLMRSYTLKLLCSLSTDGSQIEDADIVAWANNKVASAGRSTRISGFKDSTIANGLFLLDLLHSCEARAVNWDLVTPGEAPEDRENNAKYAISVARKLGCTVFLVWEDIVEVKPKMIMTFLASAMSVFG